MKSFRILLAFLGIFGIQDIGIAQIPHDFEFLDHSHLESYPGAMKTIGDNTYFVSHNFPFPMTTVHRVNANKEMETLLELPALWTRSKLFEESDSSFKLVIYSLFDYDINTPGFYVVNVEGDEIRTDTLTRLGKPNLIVYDIERDLNNWVFIRHDSIHRLDSSGAVQSSKLDDDISALFNLTSNSDEVNYIISHSGGASSIARIEGNDFVYLFEILSDDLARNMLSHESGNFVLSSQYLSQFDKDFSDVIKFWNLSEFDGEIKHLDYTDDDRVEILSESDSHFSLYYISPTSEIELIFQETLKEEESISHFTKLSSEQYLFTGTHTTENITQSTFMRNINVVDNMLVDYPSMDVAVESFEVKNTMKDTYDLWVSPVGDTVYRIEYTYEFNIELLNEEAENVDLVHAYTNPLFPTSFEAKQFVKFEGIDIDPFTIIEDDSTLIYRYYGALDEVTAVVPGANYMFNRSPNKTFDTKVISSTFDFKQHTYIDVYPNPTSDFINIPEEVKDIGIYNSNGQLVYYISKSKAHIDVTSFEAGVYFLKMRGNKEDKICTSRFIKL